MSSSTTNLCDLPPELVGLIAERTDTRSRCALRKSSKDIRQVVDDSKQVCNKIEVYANRAEQRIRFAIDNFPSFGYTLKENGCVIRSNFSGQSGNEVETTLNGEDYVEVAVNDLMTILKNPKLIVKNLTVSDDRARNEETVPPFTAALHRKLCELNHTLHVEFISLDLAEDDMLLILPFCQPKILRTLRLSGYGPNQLTRIITMEQWKQAEKLDLMGLQPLEDIFHFKQVSMPSKYSINTNPSWEEFKSYIERAVAQGEHSPKKFFYWRIFFARQLKEYAKNLVTVQERLHRRTVLKTFRDGSQIVLLFSDCSWVKIDKYVDGKSVFEVECPEIGVP